MENKSKHQEYFQSANKSHFLSSAIYFQICDSDRDIEFSCIEMVDGLVISWQSFNSIYPARCAGLKDTMRDNN